MTDSSPESYRKEMDGLVEATWFPCKPWQRLCDFHANTDSVPLGEAFCSLNMVRLQAGIWGFCFYSTCLLFSLLSSSCSAPGSVACCLVVDHGSSKTLLVQFLKILFFFFRNPQLVCRIFRYFPRFWNVLFYLVICFGVPF